MLTLPTLITPNTQQPDLLTTHSYVEQALSNNTRKAYRCDLEHYLAWGGTIPATPNTIADYLTAYATSLSIATLQRRLVSITKAHTTLNHPDPIAHELVKLTMRGIRRVHGKPQRQVTPVLKEDLMMIWQQLPNTPKGKRDKALLMLGFCAALRRSELVAIKIEDLTFTSQGLVLTLPRSKTDQTGEGRKVAIPYGRGRVCPVLSVNDWLLHLSANCNISSGHVFRSIIKGGTVTAQLLSDRAVADMIKTYTQQMGLDPANYSGHSLRSGLATSAAQHGVSSWKIRAQTGHKSEAMLARYIRDGDLFNNNAAGVLF